MEAMKKTYEELVARQTEYCIVAPFVKVLFAESAGRQ
jgi:hypothetical protein